MEQELSQRRKKSRELIMKIGDILQGEETVNVLDALGNMIVMICLSSDIKKYELLDRLSRTFDHLRKMD